MIDQEAGSCEAIRGNRLGRPDALTHDHSGQACAQHHHGAAPGCAVDPVCGMSVDPATTPYRIEHGGQTLSFCSDRCRTKFADGLAKSLSDGSKLATCANVPAGTIYTCPMHLQIR
jgi:Cu+-exporting ATPase